MIFEQFNYGLKEFYESMDLEKYEKSAKPLKNIMYNVDIFYKTYF